MSSQFWYKSGYKLKPLAVKDFVLKSSRDEELDEKSNRPAIRKILRRRDGELTRIL